MEVGRIFYSSIPYAKTTPSSKTNQEQNNFPSILEKAIENASTLDELAQKVDKLAQKYDIRNATFEEFEVIALNLQNKGKISVEECGDMTFNPNKGWLKDNFFFATPEDSSGRRDWVIEFEKRAERSLKQYGLIENYRQEVKIANVLKELSAVREKQVTRG